MPRRPRQHQLETESQAAIRTAVPSKWVYRDLKDDYGVDSEVEIFDDEGRGTGEKFLVQLKATDERDLGKALRVWLPRAKLRYFASLEQPVLLVRFHAPTQTLYARWFHSWDPYYEPMRRAGASLLFREEDLWNEATSTSIERDVRAFRDVRSPRIPGPISFSLQCDGDFHGTPSFEVKLRLKESCHDLRHIINFDGDSTSPYRIHLSDELIEVRIAGSHGCSLHSKGQPDAESSPPTHHDIIMAIALAVDQTGHAVEAAQIMEPFLPQSRLVAQPEVALMAALCLAKANQMHLALEVAALLFEDDTSAYSARVFLLPLLARHSQMPATAQDLCVRVLRKGSEQLESRSDKSGAASLEYTCGNYLRSLGRLREALSTYRRAAQLDPEYEKREYYWRELGGILFMGQRYRAAVTVYARALTIKDQRFTKLLHADALMFAGEYKRAEEEFAQLLETPIDTEDFEWALKRLALSLDSPTGGYRRSEPREGEVP